MWFMPLAFSVMFFFFPAGLVLYWITNNVLSIAQQWLINKRMGVPPQLPKFRQPACRKRRRRRAAKAALFAGRIAAMLARTTDPIAAIATAPGPRRGRHRARLRRALAPLIEALCGRDAQAARGDLPAVPRRRRQRHRPGPGDPLPGAAFLHRRGRAGTAGPRRPGGAAAAAGALPGGRRRSRSGDRPAPPGRPARGAAGRIHPARLPQRQDRPGAGRGHRRPDRRQHRSGGAQRQPLAVGRVLARGPRPARRADPPAHAGRGDAGLSRRGDRLPAEGRCAGPARAAARHAGARCCSARARAPCCARASRS